MGMRPGRYALKDKRWPALRLQALRRDDWQCVQCGARYRLEVDHIQAVRDHPELAFSLDNLQVLCSRHHTQKTHAERGHAPDLERERWRRLISKNHTN